MKIRQGTLEEAVALLEQVPELKQGHEFGYYASRLEDRTHLILVAEEDGAAVGFKAGYAQSEDHFYSWIGGVLPKHRKAGVAQLLLNTQEQWAWKHRFLQITVKTSPGFAGMCALLEKNAYALVATDGQKLTFRKVRPDGATGTFP